MKVRAKGRNVDAKLGFVATNKVGSMRTLTSITAPSNIHRRASTSAHVGWLLNG